MEKIEKILTDSIAEIKAGKASLDECLGRYPSLRRELEPLLKLALKIKQPSAIKLASDDKQAVKARLMQSIGLEKKQKTRSFMDIFGYGIPARFAWVRVAVSVLAIVLILSILAGGTAYASQDSLPGDLLYPLKTTTENVRLFVAGDEAHRAELNLQFAQTRLDEMSTLASKDEQRAALAVNGYKNNLRAFKQHLTVISDTATQAQILDRSVTQLQNQLLFCDDVIDSGPAYSAPVRGAAAESLATQMELLKLLEQQDVTEAAQINLDIMQNRLQRARSLAINARFTEMEEALAQYRQLCGLGEQILESSRAQGNNASQVEELSLVILTENLEVIEEIAQKTPHEYRHAVQTSRESAVNFHAQAGTRHQHGQKDEDGTGLGPPTPEFENPGNSGKGQGQNAPGQQNGNGNSGTATAPVNPSSPGGSSGSPGETGGGNKSTVINNGNMSPHDNGNGQSGNGSGFSGASQHYSGGQIENQKGR